MNHLSGYQRQFVSNILWQKEMTQFKECLFLFAGFLLLICAMQLSIPLQPVPLTFQSASVVLIGMTYGSKRGFYIVAAYLLAGALGLPIFSNYTGGVHKFFGPTGGYLIGFLPAVFVSGKLMEIGFSKNKWLTFAAAIVSSLVIFICGIALLSTLVGMKQAILLGLMPFIIPELIKLAIVACITPKFWKINSI